MAKRFRLRISRIIPSFHSCGSKDSSFSQFSPATPTVLPKHRSPLPSKPHRSFLKPHVSSAFGCCNRSKPTLSDDDRSESPPEFRWEKEDKYWHVITTPKTNDVVQTQTPRRKIYNSSAEDDDVLPPPPPPPSAEKKKKRRTKMKKQKRTTLRTIRVSTSSAESGLFSSDGFDDDVDDEEIETLVSTSRSFSTDSLGTIRELAAPNHHPTTTTRRNKKKKKKKVAKRRVSESEWWSTTETSSETAAPARLSVFQRLIPCSVEGKVRESFAVVKRSEDPYEDFKRSMMEMILEKQMFDDKDLEQLLHCFLSLNSKHHHGAIVRAFIEIWEVLFCASSTRSSSASGRRVSRAL
ncbi:hypothetical protein L484_014618 [Morus notabilis]|uniref:Transcription repressor n=1 Tax=Morus notabilis TaxID=981085 RepID=W9R6M3_9ROSA|nr:transcription repressor OFP7 [Morus notabilis]EXB59123.1 hypothetical protein L484_014618 [Morus notabilis]